MATGRRGAGGGRGGGGSDGRGGGRKGPGAGRDRRSGPGTRGQKARGPVRAPRTKASRSTRGGRPGIKVTPLAGGGAEHDVSDDGLIRLNRFLAAAGLASRRGAEDLIEAGRIVVNGETCKELGTRIDPLHDEVRFDGERLQPERPTYVVIHKPKGVVCTNAPNEQRTRVIDLLQGLRGRVFTIGRLDADSEGLILATNDGQFAQRLAHPSFGVSKTYSITVRGQVEPDALDKAQGGVWLSEGKTAGMRVSVERRFRDKTVLRVSLREGRNREIRRIFAKLGYAVTALKRVRIGPLTLRGLGSGRWRFLTHDEIEALRNVGGDDRAAGAGER